MITALARFRAISPLVLGIALLNLPLPLQGQTVPERTREEEARIRFEERLKEIREYRLQQAEQMLAEARAQSEFSQQQALAMQARAFDRQLEAREEALARIEKARAYQLQDETEVRARQEDFRQRQEEALARARDAVRRAGDAQGRARDELRRAQQVIVQMKARVRVGVSLDPTQGAAVDDQGARIQSVMRGTPAEEAGLQEGDVITHLNGQNLLVPIPDEDELGFDVDESLPVQRLMALAGDLEEGDEVEVRYVREGKAETASFEAADMIDPTIIALSGDRGALGLERLYRLRTERPGAEFFSIPDREGLRLRIEGLEDLEALRGDLPMALTVLGGPAGFGLELTELNPGLTEYFSTERGVLVLDVDEDSGLGLLPGDVIQAIDGRAVDDQGDVRRILRSYERGETIPFTVVRKGTETRVEGTIR
jgi:C-terminal processing protease CtpA/Prc